MSAIQEDKMLAIDEIVESHNAAVIRDTTGEYLITAWYEADFLNFIENKIAEANAKQRESQEFDAARMRRVAKLLGLKIAVPSDDSTLLGCIGSVMGMFARKIAEQQAILGGAITALEHAEGFIAETHHTEACADHCAADKDWMNCSCGKISVLSMVHDALSNTKPSLPAVPVSLMKGCTCADEARYLACPVHTPIEGITVSAIDVLLRCLPPSPYRDKLTAEIVALMDKIEEVPDVNGWQLVPIAPSSAMLNVGADRMRELLHGWVGGRSNQEIVRLIFEVMLKAAPKLAE